MLSVEIPSELHLRRGDSSTTKNTCLDDSYSEESHQAQIAPLSPSDSDESSILTNYSIKSSISDEFEVDEITRENADQIIHKTESTGNNIDKIPSSQTKTKCVLENESEQNVQKIRDASTQNFTRFRLQYLIVHIAIMLADGLQGTHLYVLYEGYGYSVATLYSLGFVAGTLSSPFIGPLVDKVGRKKAALLYCFLEILINYMEQYPWFIGLVLSRVIGGITTNLLYSVFESWLVTEHRSRGFEEEKLEIILRDSAIVSNSAAIVSGYIAHCLASRFGPVGPFEGAVAFTCLASILVGTMWSENYGSMTSSTMTFHEHMDGAFRTIVRDNKISRIGLIQGLTEGSLQTFVFLWSPALRAFAGSSVPHAVGLDEEGQPAYGLVFGGFMLFGVIGGFAEPVLRRTVSRLTSLIGRTTMVQLRESAPEKTTFLATNLNQKEGVIKSSDSTADGNAVIATNISFTTTRASAKASASASIDVDSTKTNSDQPQTQVDIENELVKTNQATANMLCTLCYLMSAVLLMVPYLVEKDSPYAFSICLGAFLLYELMVGTYIPCEGVIRSMYMPNESICSLMNMLRVVVNVAVAIGVISTNYIRFTTAFGILSMMMVTAASLQLSLVIDEDGKKLKAMAQQVVGYVYCHRENSCDCEDLRKKTC